MTNKTKKVIIALSVVLAVAIVLTGLLIGTNFIQVGLIRLLCPDKASTTPDNYNQIIEQTTLETFTYMEGYECDIIEPVDQTISLTVVYFHGGYYIGGGRHNQEPFVRLLASHGYRVVNADYPLAPENVYPAQVLAANSLFAFLAKKYGQNEKFAVSGDSAGSHLAAHITALITDQTVAQIVGTTAAIPTTQLVGFIGNCGYYNATTLKQAGFFLAHRSLKIVTGDMSLTNVGQLDLDKHVSAFPPSMLLCGDKDPFLGQNQLMLKALQNAGVEAESYFPTTVNKALGHEFQSNYDVAESYTAMEKIVAFLQRLV